jgi:hypothetical protein
MSRAYGPHRPTPRTIEVWGPRKFGQPRTERPVPRVIERQRRAINNAAWAAGKAAS